MNVPSAWRPLLAALVLSLAAGVAALPAAAETVLHRGNGSEPQTLDQAHAATGSEKSILQDLYEGLTVHDAAGKLAPGSAESWTVSDDGLVYTFRIRDTAKWSNGDSVTADDFVFSFRRIVNPTVAASYPDILFPIHNAVAINTMEEPVDTLGVHAIDAKTLEIVLEHPTPWFLEALAHPAALPVHQATVEALGADFTRPGTMVSNGAFMLAEDAAGDHVTVVRNPDYWDAATVRLDKVVFYPSEDQAAAVRRFAAGALDLNRGFPPDEAAALADRFGRDVVQMTPSLSAEYYVFDTRRPPFDDARVRQALSMAIDRTALARIVSVPVLPLYSLVPPGIAGYAPADAPYVTLTQAAREGKARALLADAGYDPGGEPLNIEIRYNTGEDHARVAAAVAGMWTALGAEVKLTPVATREHYAALQNGDAFSVARAGWTAAYADPEGFLALAVSTAGLFIYSRFADAGYDALVTESAGAADPATRTRDLHAAEAILMRDQPVAPLLVNAASWLVSDKVKGWQANVVDDHLSRYLAIE
jgi:oligopeptide transport system substrate-binding protein